MQENFVCFHNPDEEHGWLSNWALSDFEVGGVKFSSMEQYMMYCKAKLFCDDETMKKILNTTDVKKIKALGREVYPFNPTIWSTYGLLFVTEGLFAKYRQNPELKEKLLATGDKILVECAVRDHIWAIGRSLKDDRRFDLSAWDGENRLGFATMFVRDKLREEEPVGDKTEDSTNPPW